MMMTRDPASAAASNSTHDPKRWPAVCVKQKHDYDRAAGGAKTAGAPKDSES